MRNLISLVLLFLCVVTSAQNPLIVKTVSGTEMRPYDNSQQNWQSNQWNGLFFYFGTGTPTKLCVTDGTTAGTKFLANVGAGLPNRIFVAKDFIYAITTELISPSPYTIKSEIWKSDGTAAGTTLVYTMPNAVGFTNANQFGSNSNTIDNFSLDATTNLMYFGGYDATNGNELWVTDGTAAGTHIVKDIKAGAGNSNPWGFCKIGNDVFFNCTEVGLERKLWKTDGTAAGTVQIAVAEPFFIVNGNIGKLGNKFIFDAHNTVDGYERYVSDGTAAGTFMLANINPTGDSYLAASEEVSFKSNSKYCFFIARNGIDTSLYRTDGTSAGTIRLTPNGVSLKNGVSSGGYSDIDESGLWMVQYNSVGGGNAEKIWKSDGTLEGTYMAAQNISYGQKLKIYKNALWMQARNIGSAANTEPWRCGGNQATTNIALEIRPENSGSPIFAPFSSDPFGFFVKNNKLYFFATRSSGPTINLYEYTGDFTFNGNLAGGNWKDSANWNGMMPPGITDSVYVNAGTPNALNIATGNAYAGTLLLGNNAVVNIATATDSIIVNTRIAAAGNNSFTGNGVVALRNIAADTVEINDGFSTANLALQSHASAAAGTLSVNNNLNLTNNSQLMVNNGSIVLTGSTSTITQTGNSYINTNGIGKLTIENIGAAGRTGAVNFPVGTSSYYNPVTFTNAGVMDNFSVRVQPQVFAAYTGETGTGAYTATAVNATWFITETNTGGSNADVVLQWDALQELPGFDRSISRFGHYNSSWQLGTPSTAAGSNPYTFSGTGITSFSPFGILNNAGALPLRFIQFAAQKCNSNNVCINWQTTSEINVSHFIVERSLDGQLYTPVTTVAAQNGLINNYVFTDDIALLQYSSKIYYRIKQTDADGKSSFSNVQVIKADINKIEIYPNPVADRLYFTNWQQIKTIQLFSADGKLLQVVFSNQNYIDVKTLPNGTYFIKTTSKQNETGMHSFIKR
ncbi:T9SS type A sorting domain-containing protein [Ferruginibacter sp.]|nr:T9SS type A sorting domain-containing protein [Ferruginibacter sp.]